jgi:hypothetical protein
MILNMFRASQCSSSGGQLYIYNIWYRPTLYGSIQSVTIPDTVNIQTVLLKMSTAMLETCGGSRCNIIIKINKIVH